MQMNEVTFEQGQPIDGYGPGFFRVAGELVEGAILLSPSGLVPWGGYGDVDAILARAGEMDVLFIGTGAEIAHIPAALRQRLEAAGLGVEVAATPSACRTYNVLLSEGRRAGVALLPV